MGKITKFPEKHREVIQAWIDGKDIEISTPSSGFWTTVDYSPNFGENFEYRVKKDKVKKWKFACFNPKYDSIYAEITDHRSDQEIEECRNVFPDLKYLKILATEIEE